jgi:hypothetical protein
VDILPFKQKRNIQELLVELVKSKKFFVDFKNKVEKTPKTLQLPDTTPKFSKDTHPIIRGTRIRKPTLDQLGLASFQQQTSFYSQGM